jgi:hypothetical protein
MAWMERLQVFGGVSAIIALATYNVIGPKTKAVKPGHDTFSSEKPEALRKEMKRDLEEERAKVEQAARQRAAQ